jgi:hypothetical protein
MRALFLGREFGISPFVRLLFSSFTTSPAPSWMDLHFPIPFFSMPLRKSNDEWLNIPAVVEQDHEDMDNDPASVQVEQAVKKRGNEATVVHAGNTQTTELIPTVSLNQDDSHAIACLVQYKCTSRK